MVSGEIEVNKLPQIRLNLETTFSDDPFKILTWRQLKTMFF